MALTDIDVISALNDPVLQRMDFRVAGVHVRGAAYATIADLIDREQILVVSGNNPSPPTTTPRPTPSRRRRLTLRPTSGTVRC